MRVNHLFIKSVFLSIVFNSLTGGDYYDYQVKNGQGYEIELSIKDNNVQLEKLTPIAMEEAEEKDK